MKKILSLIITLVITFGLVYTKELPKPTYDNSLIFSMTHNFLNDSSADLQAIVDQYKNGIYAPFYFSKFEAVEMDWNIDPNNSGSNIQEFKADLDSSVLFAKTYNVGIHLTITYGLARNVHLYKTAKEEDIRNAQWYNDNNISASNQMREAASRQQGTPTAGLNHITGDSLAGTQAATSVINRYVFTTLSRYARKVRGHLDAKVTAAFAYLKQVQDANPNIKIIISAPGEAELNYNRRDDSKANQDYFCDYSPFAVLEFRDWIRHEGLYAVGEKYTGDGFAGGGSRYQGGSGLSNFNADFGTSFSSWDLKYYPWDLSDTIDTNYTDSTDPDPNRIPVSYYNYGVMMPTSGSDYTSGGFDPPRTMETAGTDDFYDLWAEFREFMVYHYVKDMSSIARDSGFPKDQYFTHQIPGDYLFGTRPNDPLIPTLNPRYYSSAAPMWTADVFSDIGVGATLYDVNLGSFIARTTKYGISGAASFSDNWAALEYNPEVIPSGLGAVLSDVNTLYNEMIRLYNGSPHVISFFKWEGTDYAFKDTNRGTASLQFFNIIKNKARQSVSTVFTPKQLEEVTATYNTTTALVNLDWSDLIWTDLSFNWSHWGDFKEFVIYRGYSEDFTASGSSEVTRTTASEYTDYGFSYGTTVYYKIAAVNVSGEVGAVTTVSVVTPAGNPIPAMSVSRDRFNFGYIVGGNTPPSQSLTLSNTGAGALIWNAVADVSWVSCTPASGTNGAVVSVNIDPTDLASGAYSGTITISSPDPRTINAPQTIAVYLTVKNSNQNQAPFGEFATPEDGSTVRSSIAVTGWVLDDTGVQGVRIYRDPVSGEGNDLMAIGDAVFVEGARGDIETGYPDYPENYKAGWGYMMLTNFLPNSGNGTFKLYAIATDANGLQKTLGTKTITVDNATAVKPFGAIESPGQGGIASGTAYRNWGWALTPPPNSIPTDGSTIEVLIDGVLIGNPVYSLFRNDVATLFPGYANSDGAFGYFDFDATQFADGVHTIEWSVTDNAGNRDGIGSRYFTIQNVASNRSQASAQSFPVSFQFAEQVSKLPVKHNRLSKTSRSFEINELDRIVIPLDMSGQVVGYHVIGKQLKRLPIGSTLDSEKGIFYWQPGAAFLGNYDLVFVARDQDNKLRKQQIRVTINPKTSHK